MTKLIRLSAQQPSPTSPNGVYRKPLRVMKSFLPALAITLSFFGAAYAFDVEYCNNQGECFGINVPGTGFACNDVRPGFENLIQQVVIITAHGCGVHQYELGLGSQPGVVQPRERMVPISFTDRPSAVVELRAPVSIIIRLRYSRKLVSTVHAKHKAECSLLVVYFTKKSALLLLVQRFILVGTVRAQT
ncbi:hypothetical protein B0H13DRAFT_1860567 [Mycena leptocephala]|nr:hypothetical protein B0H13DRAFT_1860567 [Mycena leptocephala]